MAYFYYAGKRIFYTESGSGIPCVFLHGNTASSKMFQFILPLYEQTMGIVLLDFWGTENPNAFAVSRMNCGSTRGCRW